MHCTPSVMNPSEPVQLQPQPLPQPHRSSFACDRHPDEHFTGFCPSCLCERLAGLDQSSAARKSTSTSSAASSTAAAALKAIFKGGSGGGPDKSSSFRPKPSSSSFFPELRRTKSFSASKGEGFSGVVEPQRKSCDVRVRNTLWTLFNLDDERKGSNKREPWGEIEVDTRNLGPSCVAGPVFESKEEDETEDEIRVSVEPNVVVNGVEDRVEEIIEEEEELEQIRQLPQQQKQQQQHQLLLLPELDDFKTMKDHIDLDSQNKKPPGRDLKEIAGSFWSAASVFSKKLQKWRRKQKMKKRDNGGGSATLPVEKPIERQYRETQSEIADYGFGRRSCDTDPRFSLDAGRISFDDPRYSFDEPRASWDGYLIGRTFPRLAPMVSVVEDAPVHVLRSDNQIPVEEPRNSSVNEDESIPGGSAQTRDYYSDSSSRRRKSLDRSNSIRRTAAAVVAEIDEMKSVSNAKVSPATIDYIHGPKLVPAEKDLRDSNSNSLRDDCSESFEMAFRDAASITGNGERKGSKKSSRWRAWNIWGFIHRRSGTKDEDDDRFSRVNGVERSLSESWPELRGERNGDVRGSFNRKVFRSNSSVSSRNTFNIGGSFSSTRKNSAETNGHGKKRRDEFVLERNRSARYSPNNIDNGLLRFYLTPLRSSRKGGSGKPRPSNSHSIARSVLRLY